MAVAGYRITEGGDSRILQNGDVRVTEGFQTAEAALSASSGFDFLGVLNATASASITGTSTLSASGDVTRYGASMVANNSAISATGARITQGASALSAEGAMVAFPHLILKGATNLSGSSTISPDGRVKKYVEVVSGQAIFTRILESEDTRITESGDTRITNIIPTNEIVGSLVAYDDYTPFSSTAYYKTGGVWKQSDVYVKNNGNWTAPLAVYKKISGSWKRIY
jgi:hypothetical protein